MDSAIRKRIELLRFLMIFGVVMLHTPEYVQIAEIGHDWFSLTKAFFQNALFRTTVPVLTCISGYLVFHSGIDRMPRKLAVKKVRSLLLPFLIFNLPLVLVVFLAESFTNLHTNYRLVPFDAAVWRDATFGIMNSPINYPLNFLRDMIVLMCLAPALGWLIRKVPATGFVLVCIVFLKDLDGILVLRNLMAVLFYLGGVAAVYRWNLRALDRYALPCAVAFLLLCGGIVCFRIANTTALRLVAPLLVWPASALLLGTRCGEWCVRLNRYSFLLFVAHAPILFATWLMYKHAGSAMPYPVYWFCAPLATTVAIVALYHAGMRIVPDALTLALGGRAAKLPAPAAAVAPATGPVVPPIVQPAVALD